MQMPASSRGAFAELLQESADLAEQVLHLLTLTTLGRLQCTCKAAHTAVSRLPEAWWQVSTEQADYQLQQGQL